MAKEKVGFNPELSKGQKAQFLQFAISLHEEMKGKRSATKDEILIAHREMIEKKFAGKKHHELVELAFAQSLLIDLLLQDWKLKIKDKEIFLEHQAGDREKLDVQTEKEKVRKRHLLTRNAQLRQPTVVDFIKGMERRRLTERGWHSIYSLMRDGKELAGRLEQLSKVESLDSKVEELGKVISPYIQFVEPGVVCRETGLLLSEIWRYFRHTWVSEYKSLPGRSISILIRDAAAPNHPVIAIAALGSSVAQQTCRDIWIGWDGPTFLKQIEANPTSKKGKWILETHRNLLTQIYLKDFFKSGLITTSQIRNPDETLIKKLRMLSEKEMAKHISKPQSAKFTKENAELSWEERAGTYLFTRKRANALQELLSIQIIFNKYGFKQGTKAELEKCLQYAEFKSAIERLIRKEKSIHVGINMMDIIICGSIAPYNHILGGKLVCMMLTSPEVVNYYHDKYQDAVSLIASSMRGKAVQREPQLVLLGTTSLYGVGSSQYNRIKMPVKAILEEDSNEVIEYRDLGFSEGFGSFHFSSFTTRFANTIVGIKNNDRTRVNSIFGEGANPLLRKIKDAIEILGLESKPMLNHRNRRVVYGISLARNFREVLTGLADRPQYYLPKSKPKEKSRQIAKFWTTRWLSNRINNPEVLAQVAKHGLSYPIVHGAKVPLEENEVTLFD